ncbi:hypothetical protein EMIT0P2_20370 [Pseudomonas sp. IT-P2]
MISDKYWGRWIMGLSVDDYFIDIPNITITNNPI